MKFYISGQTGLLVIFANVTYFQKNFKKNKTYIIYNIDPSEFANHDTSYLWILKNL